MKLSDSLKKQILGKIDRAVQYKKTDVTPKDKERLQRFRSDKDYYASKLENLKMYSFSDTSVMSAVERMTAQLMKMVFGTDDIGSIKGRHAEDDGNGEIMQETCNWQIEYPNKGYQKFYWWFKESLYQLYSVVIVTQKREYKEVEEEVVIPNAAAEVFMNTCIERGTDIVEVNESPQLGQDGQPQWNVKIRYTKLAENYPLIENVPTEELFWTPGAKTLRDAEIVGRRKEVTIDHLVRNIKKKQADGTYTGMYDKAAVMELAAGSSGSAMADDDNMTAVRQGYTDGNSYDIDDPNRKVTICECFVKADINNDKMLEDCIITIVEDGNVVIRYEENEDGFPFCIVSPVFDPYRVVPDISGIDALGQWQDLLTAIIRLTVQNLALNNNPQQLVNSSLFADFNQVLDGDAFLEVNGDPSQAMRPVAEVPLAPYTLQLIEMVKGWGEEASNVNRYNQGIDSSTLNKTATGITALINQGSQAMELIMRNIAETGLKELFMRMVYLNQKYIDHDQVIRLTNRDIVVNKDNLKGDFDYIVNAGMGAGAKETDIQNLQMLKADMPMLMQAGLADVKCAYNLEKKLYELSGIRNIDDYLIDPAKNQQPPQAQQPDDKPNVSANIKDAPPEIQAQFWSKLGFSATPDMFVQQQLADAHKEAAKIHLQSQAKREEAVVNGQIRASESLAAGAGGQGGTSLPWQSVQENPAGVAPGSNQIAV